MSMNLKLISHPAIFNGLPVVGISGSPNGCFCLHTKDEKGQKKLFLFNQNGKCIVQNLEARDAALLNDNAYFTVDFPDCRKLFDCFITLHAADGTPIKRHLSTFQVYRNGWYMITEGEHQKLYTESHNLVAEDFSQCAVYPSGYAIRSNCTCYKYADWTRFTVDGQFINHSHNIAAILGDGFPLAYNADDKDFLLYDLTGTEVLVRHIESFQTFPNGRFCLSISAAYNQEFVRIFDADGTPSSILDDVLTCLPDGRFLSYFTGRVLALYRSDGFMALSGTWRGCQLAGNYYLLNDGKTTTLFNDKSENLGKGYVLEAFAENFSLLKNEGAFHLFNQYGEVLSLPYEG